MSCTHCHRLIYSFDDRHQALYHPQEQQVAAAAVPDAPQAPVASSNITAQEAHLGENDWDISTNEEPEEQGPEHINDYDPEREAMG